MARRRMKQGWKMGNRRHQTQAGSSADSQDRAIERTERQAARREIEAEVQQILQDEFLRDLEASEG